MVHHEPTRVFEFIRSSLGSGGHVVDIGAMLEESAELFRSAGWTYVALTDQKTTLLDLTRRGFQAEYLDADERAPDTLTKLVDGLAVSGFIISGRSDRNMITAITAASGPATMVVSIETTDPSPAGAAAPWLSLSGWQRFDRTDKPAADPTPLASWTGSAHLLNQYLTHITELTHQSGISAADMTVWIREGTESEKATLIALSVIMRTRGTRNELLDEALLSLAGQDREDFEVLLLVHNPDPVAIDGVRKVVATYAPEFIERVQVIPVIGGGRSRPLNEGLSVARGVLIAFLDDDDVAMSDWVDVFVKASVEYPGTVIRTVAADQEVERLGHSYRLISGPKVLPERLGFHMIRHLESNRTPICSFAVPSAAIDTFHLRFNDLLPVLEDWDFLIRVATLCGVTAVDQVTSIYRRWHETESSWNTVHRDDWASTHQHITAELDRAPLLLPEGSAGVVAEFVRKLSQRSTELKNVRGESARRIASLEKQLAAARRRISSMENSRSWRLTRPLRSIRGSMKRN